MARNPSVGSVRASAGTPINPQTPERRFWAFSFRYWTEIDRFGSATVWSIDDLLNATIGVAKK